MRLSHLLLTFYCLVFLIAAACSTKSPSNELEAVKYTGTLKVGTSAGYPPFVFLNDDGEIAGLDIEVVRELAKRMGVRAEFFNMPYEQLVPALLGGKIDMAIAAFNNTGLNNKSVGFTDAYFKFEEGLEVEMPSNHPGMDGGALFIALPENASELAKVLNKIIADMTADGFLEDLAGKYNLSIQQD